ncbi:MAG TPA: MoaD/ThiS family protein [Candidatus Limnocylindrales bacterium]|nr:MoaD/ThiS family protein [Candidatus Limnocylindrales bacterium]
MPASLRRDGKARAINMDLPAGATLRSVFDEIDRWIPGSLEKMVKPDGRLHGYVNVYVNGVDVRFAGGLATQVSEGDEIVILPAISGG